MISVLRTVPLCAAPLLLAAVCPHLSAQAPARTAPLTPGKEAAIDVPQVILTAGHRNNSHKYPGAPGERPLTGRYADAYAERLTSEGFKVHYIQRMDDDNRSDWYSGGLDKVAKRVVSVAHSLGSSHSIVMLDVHMEGPSNNAGVFVIVPDGAGLGRTASTSPDTWENNRRSRELGRGISFGISEATGIPLRRSKERGLMSEKQTGVAESGGRLAMFSHTVELRERMERLVVEHGNLRMDASLLHDPATPVKTAGAVASALRNFYGVPARQPAPARPVATSSGSQPVFPAPSAPAGRYAGRIAPPPMDGRDHQVNRVDFVAVRRRVVIARNGVPALRYADPVAAQVRAPFRAGEVVEVAFFVRGASFEGNDHWWVAVDGTRIPMAGTVEKMRRE